MKSDDLLKLVGEVDDWMILEAEKPVKKPRFRYVKTVGLVASLCIVVAAFIIFKQHVNDRDSRDNYNGNVSNANGNVKEAGIMMVKAAYPEQKYKEVIENQYAANDAHFKWWNEHRKLINESCLLQEDMKRYYSKIMSQLLVSKDENTVCSPLNTYIAFSALAEVTEGDTRQQLLNMLGVSNIETLRENISALWKSNYVETPIIKSVLANSVWLNNHVTYNESTLKTLAEKYYASSFSGEPGSEAMNQALRTWTDENTDGLLSEYTRNMSMSPASVLEIISTIYYKAMWAERFAETNTEQEVFHGTRGDTTVAMMKNVINTGFYTRENFTSIGLPLSDSGKMYFFLPNENVDVNDLASDPEVVNILPFKSEVEDYENKKVYLSVPKFNVSGNADLISAMKAMGVTEVLDTSMADFSPLTTEDDSIYLNKATHTAMFEIDEEGVSGAAYTVLDMYTSGLPVGGAIEFVLDRPFMFIVTGMDNSILFSGIVRNIE